MARTHHRILHAGASHRSASQLPACSIQRAPNLTRMYSRMHAPTTHCNSCARMLLSPAQLFVCARVRRRRTAAPALACSFSPPMERSPWLFAASARERFRSKREVEKWVKKERGWVDIIKKIHGGLQSSCGSLGVQAWSASGGRGEGSVPWEPDPQSLGKPRSALTGTMARIMFIVLLGAVNCGVLAVCFGPQSHSGALNMLWTHLIRITCDRSQPMPVQRLWKCAM